jgi:quercetin dioxygenase-like cupin family protein
MAAPRRVVTGHDETGRSIFLSDGPVPVTRNSEEVRLIFHEVWNTVGDLAPIAPSEPEPTERPLRIAPERAGTNIRVNEFLPGALTPMHRTSSVDYGIVLEGEITLILTDSEADLRAGDIVVQRGTDHAWHNRSQGVTRMAFILVGGEFSGELSSLREDGLDSLTDEIN